MIRRVSARAMWLAFSGVTMATGVFFAGMYVARATPGGETRRALSFSGTLTGRTGPQAMVFTFRKGASEVCAPMVTTTPEPTTGAVHVEIPLGSCPTSLFDGADVTFEVSVGGTVLAPSQPINPVPYAAYADRVGTPDCPTGYERFTEASMPAEAIYCRKGNDEVVRVGTGATAFWIDRYLASVWSNSDGTGTQYVSGTGTPVANNGAWTTPVYGVSRRGVQSTGSVSWRQANAFCRASGKRLPTAMEWNEAARNTPGYGTDFRVRPDECPGARGLAYDTGSTPLCVSAWGVEQAVGYKEQWGEGHLPILYASGSVSGSPSAQVFGTGFNPIGVRGYLIQSGGTTSATIPPPYEGSGFRCVIPR